MYKKYTDEELIEVYTSMIEYSGKANTEVLHEIELRGGLDNFKRRIEQKAIIEQEKSRISKEIFSLTSTATDAEFIKSLVTSDILSKEQVDELVENKFASFQAFNKNRQINSKTIIGSIIGIVVGTILGGWLLYVISKKLDGIYYFLIVPIYIINYLIILLITKRTRTNLVVLIASILATIGALVLFLYRIGVV